MANLFNEFFPKPQSHDYGLYDPSKIYWTNCFNCGTEVQDKYGDWYNLCTECGEKETDMIEDCVRATKRQDKIKIFVEKCIKNLPADILTGFVIPDEFYNFGHCIEDEFYEQLGERLETIYVTKYNIRCKKIYVKGTYGSL